MSEPAWGQVGAHSRFHAVRARLEAMAVEPGPRGWFLEFFVFGFKQGWACLFGGLMLALLLGTHFFWPEGAAIHRYDAITIGAVLIQLAMLAFRLETPREALVILIFHIVGTVMELFKTAAGSWQYPEASLLHIGAVPLFSGFMYAAVGSYIARVWRIFDFRYTGYPPIWATYALAAAIYVNFFAHHWLYDIRWFLFAATALLFWRCQVWFRPLHVHRRMPLLVGWGMVALFIWFAENIGTFARAWSYPNQDDVWEMVGIEKLGSWYLLMIISFVLVSLVQRPKAPDVGEDEAASRLYPESLWAVAIEDDVLTVTDDKGVRRAIALSALSSIVIATDDSGPWGADVWWLFYDPDGQLGPAYPQGATGERFLLDRLTQLPGFDHAAMIAAMGSTDVATFTVWRE